MSLVDYPDSDSDAGDQDTTAAAPAQPAQLAATVGVKRKRTEPIPDDLPRLPAAFHDLYSTNARVSTSDDPSLHGGRKRAVPHIEGNWPSHVYLEWNPSQTESDALHGLIQHVKNVLVRENTTRTKQLRIPEITSSLQSELAASLPLHVSMSRTLQVKTQDKETIVETLRQSLRRASVRAFHFGFHGLKWVPNFERSRWFLVLGIEKSPHDELNRLLDACNQAAETFGHSGLYVGGQGDGPMHGDAPNNSSKREASDELGTLKTDRSEYFHITIAWNLLEPDPEWVSLVQSIDVSKHIKSPQEAFHAVKARIGNVVHNIDLAPRRADLGKNGSTLGS